MEQDLVSLPAEDLNAQAEQLVENSIQLGKRTLAEITAAAVKRWLKAGGSGGEFFTPEEKAKLAEAMAAAFGTAELLGRSRVRQKMAKAVIDNEPALAESLGLNRAGRVVLLEDFQPLPPERALEYFRGLTPTLGTDPQRFGEDSRRRAFTLAAATEENLLRQVQGVVAERISTGTGISTAPGEINALLARAGVSPSNPQYAEMVFRTNTKDAFTQGATQELQDPDVTETFPVWQYSNPDDTRSRKDHADRDGKYYPNSVAFTEVRGTSIEDVANCRCDQIPIDKWEWAKLRKQGARIADGYPDVPAFDEAPTTTQPQREPEALDRLSSLPDEDKLAELQRFAGVNQIGRKDFSFQAAKEWQAMIRQVEISDVAAARQQVLDAVNRLGRDPMGSLTIAQLAQEVPGLTPRQLHRVLDALASERQVLLQPHTRSFSLSDTPGDLGAIPRAELDYLQPAEGEVLRFVRAV